MQKIMKATLVAALFVFLVSVGTLAVPSRSQTAPEPDGPMQFFVKLIPPRPTFATDMTPKEGEIMGRHAAYWAGQVKTGKVLVIGPVLDPKGAFGMAVLEVASEAEAHALAEGDPSVKEGLNRVEVSPMHVFLRKH